MSEAAILEVHTDSADVDKFIVEHLGPVCNGHPLPLVNAAFLAVLIQSQGPKDITPEEVYKGITEASGYICTYLSSLRDTSRPN